MSRHVTLHPTLSWVADSASRISRNLVLSARPFSRSATWLALIARMSAVTSDTTATKKENISNYHSLIEIKLKPFLKNRLLLMHTLLSWRNVGQPTKMRTTAFRERRGMQEYQMTEAKSNHRTIIYSIPMVKRSTGVANADKGPSITVWKGPIYEKMVRIYIHKCRTYPCRHTRPLLLERRMLLIMGAAW